MPRIPCIGYTGFGAYVPETEITNEALAEWVETSDEWIRRRTGIGGRRILGERESILGMAVSAARSALDDAGVRAEEIGEIRVGVNTWMRFPSLATELQREIGARNAAASDISAGCAGFLYAVEGAFEKILAERVKYDRELIALVVGVDGLSYITDWTDRSTCVLLGDGAGAVVLREVPRGGILATHTRAQGQYGHLLYSDHVLQNQYSEESGGFTREEKTTHPYLHMDGPKVYAIAIDSMVADVHAVIEKYNALGGERIDLDRIDYVYPHQANLRILEQVAARLGIDLDRVYTAGVVRYGNTSTASIPLGYFDRKSDPRKLDRDRYEIDVSFGAGFASGAILRKVCAR